MPRFRPALLVVTALAVAFAATACSIGGSGGSTTVPITHGAVTPTSTVPGGPDGVGTLRTFHAAVTVDGGGSGYFDSTMTTTSVDTAAGTETRITKIVFTLNQGVDQLILEGSAVYPATGSTIKVAATVSRPVIGGSGAYAGARGWAESTRLADGTWSHVFHLQP
jgi:hypothetical protein